MELIGRISKGSKMDQIYIPKNRIGFSAGEYVLILPIKGRLEEAGEKDKIIDNKSVVIGEVGLGGEIRSVGNIEKRIQEAEKLGFNKIFIPGNNLKGLKLNTEINITGVNNIGEIFQSIYK